MERFLVRKSAPQSEVQHLVNHLKEVPLKKKSIAKRAPYKNKPWSDWDADQRGAAAELYRYAGFGKCTLQYGSTCPPESTLRDWGKKLPAQGFIAPRGRLGKVSAQEAKALKEYFNAVWAEGASVDGETVTVLVDKLMEKTRSHLPVENAIFYRSLGERLEAQEGFYMERKRHRLATINNCRYFY